MSPEKKKGNSNLKTCYYVITETVHKVLSGLRRAGQVCLQKSQAPNPYDAQTSGHLLSPGLLPVAEVPSGKNGDREEGEAYLRVLGKLSSTL